MRGNRVYISSIQKRMFFLAFATAFVAAFTQTLAVLVDNIIVCAFYGEQEIAAVALAGPFFYLLEIPAAGLAAGIQTVCAKEIGAGQIDKANRQFNQMFFLSAVVLVGLTVLAFLFVDQIAVLCGARGETAVLKPLAAEFLSGLSFEIVPYVLFCIMTPIVLLDNGGKLVTIASVCGCATDVALDLCSVFFGWGLFGIGLASSLSAVVYFLITGIHFLDRSAVIKLYYARVCIRELKEIFIFSLPKALLSLSNVFRTLLLITLVSTTGGVIGTCVLSIHETVSYFVIIIARGVAGAVGIMSAIYYGEKNGEDLEGVNVLAQRYGWILSAVVMAALAACAVPLARLLMESDASEDLLLFAFGCIIAMTPFMLMVQVRISYLQAVGMIKEAQFMGLCSDLIVLGAVACLLVLPAGVHGVFIAFPVTQIIILAISWGAHCKRAKKWLPPGRDYLEVEDSFFVQPGDVISYPIRTVRECILTRDQIMLFCRGHKLDEKKGYIAGLCAEELAMNALEALEAMEGSRMGERTGDLRVAEPVDIRVVIDEGDVIVRVRNAGPAFNPESFGEYATDGEHSEKSARIRILANAPKNVSYYRTYGMSTTIVTV